jgi:glycosyltransferase involved in cell wall biosynthesis
MTLARTTKRRLLVLAPFPPSENATHGCPRVMAQLLAGLAEDNRIALLAIRTGDEPPIDPELRRRCDIAEEIPRAAGAWSLGRKVARRLQLAVDLARGVPQWPSDWAVTAYRERVVAVAADWRPDVVQVETPVMAQYVPALAGSGAPRILVEHDPGVGAARERLHAARGLTRLDASLELRAWQRFERAAIASVDSVIVFTARDEAQVAALDPRTRIVQIPLGTTVPSAPLDPLGVDPPRLVFVGNFVHPPNIDAASRLVSAIFPLVRARHPELTLDVVGPDPPDALRRGAGEGVTFHGRVPDVTPYLARAAAVVTPLRLGGGMRVKVLEAMAAGKAVVASGLAIEGLSVTNQEQVRLAETDAEFAQVITELLEDRPARAALAGRAREWARTHLGWEHAVAAYEAVYDELARDHARAPLPQAARR